MKPLFRIVLALSAAGAAGAIWSWRRLRRNQPGETGWRFRLPAFSAGASAHVDSATASWHFNFGSKQKAAADTEASATALPPAASAGFYVFDDESHRRARIHHSDCRYCKPAGDSWRGPYADADAATAAADELGRADTRFCQSCCAQLSAG